MKSLAKAAKDYLALRRALGFKLRHETWWLPDFVAYVKTHGSCVITTELALGWARQPVGCDPSWWAKRLGAVRRFARHHRAFDPRTEVPEQELIPYQRQRKTPHIYSSTQILALMRHASHLPHSFQAATYTTLLGLLASTGMRVGEAIALDLQDVDWHRMLVTVRHAKFNKSREIPIHHTTLDALRAYAQQRGRVPCKVPNFFVSRAGTRLLEQNIGCVFSRLRKQADVSSRCGRQPRVHDLRHTFAVRTLQQWYSEGLDVERRLLWLSTYLGHVAPSTTYWYLTATPELLALASERAERAWKERS
jgi:integrase/recombinase XerD